jgi:anti-sigma regulatory factor (Ser/Thr protein kinase)
MKEIWCTASSESLRLILEFINQGMEQVATDSMTQMKILLAVEETIVNVIQHAYPEGQEGVVRIAYVSDKPATYFQVFVEDQGVPFNPLHHEALSVPNFIAVGSGWEIGGCGIFLILELMDQVEYHRVGDTNQLILTKYLDLM